MMLKSLPIMSPNRVCAPSRLRLGSAERKQPLRAHATMRALVLDLGGIMVEPGEQHRKSYNEAFQAFDVLQVNSPTRKILQWSEGYYAELENRASGNKLEYFFDANGWSPSKLTSSVPNTKEEKERLVSELMAFKQKRFQQMLEDREVALEPRPGVVRVMDEAADLGIKLAVCTTNKARASLVATLNTLLGEERTAKLDCLLAGDDVQKQKPDPAVYQTAAAALGVQPNECVCIEDSTTGLQAARKAGMRVVVTYTDATKTQAFEGAERVISALGYPANVTAMELKQRRIVQDDRIYMDVTDNAIQFMTDPGSFPGGK